MWGWLKKRGRFDAPQGGDWNNLIGGKRGWGKNVMDYKKKTFAKRASREIFS